MTWTLVLLYCAGMIASSCLPVVIPTPYTDLAKCMEDGRIAEKGLRFELSKCVPHQSNTGERP